MSNATVRSLELYDAPPSTPGGMNTLRVQAEMTDGRTVEVTMTGNGDGFSPAAVATKLRQLAEAICPSMALTPAGQRWPKPPLATRLHPPRVVPPVDRSKVELTSGKPIPEDGSHLTLDKGGQQTGYVVLSPEERSKGFIRPVRSKYIHASDKGGCGALTVMGQALAETYARDPKFYGGTFCVGCKKHFPVAEFIWDDTTEVVGS